MTSSEVGRDESTGMIHTFGYEKLAVEFDWFSWTPERGERVRFLTRDEMAGRFYDDDWANNDRVVAGWNHAMDDLFGAHVTISQVRPGWWPDPTDMRSSVEGIVLELESDSLEGWEYSKDMFVPLSVSVPFRQFVRQTVDNVKGGR